MNMLSLPPSSFSTSSSTTSSSCSSSNSSTPRLLRTRYFSNNNNNDCDGDTFDEFDSSTPQEQEEHHVHQNHHHQPQLQKYLQPEDNDSIVKFKSENNIQSKNNTIYLDICSSSAHSFSSTSTLTTKPLIISLAWRNLRYEVRRKSYNPFSKPKVILKRLNGFIEYHSLTGFMGPSGAGKTTLLNCLNGNLSSGLTKDSEIYLNKFERQAPKISFIEQHVHETIIGRMTVREILRYAFLFKNGWKFHQRIISHIDSVIKELLLDPTILDNRFDHCSGGEQKRIAVAQELMSLCSPSLLFVDEPTTGLDSNAALLVMKCLRKLATRYRMSITVSIHTPSVEIVQLFDKLYILAKGGVCIYSGPPNMLKENLQQKLNIDELDERPPIEHYLKIACNAPETNQVRILADETLKSEHDLILPQLNKLDFLHWGMPRHLKPFRFSDFFLQLHRLVKVVFVTDWHIFLAQIIIYLMAYIGLVLVFDPRMVWPSGCYSMMDNSNNDSTNNNQTCAEQIENDNLIETNINYQSLCVMITGFSMVGLGSLVFAPLLKVFRNEHRNRWYSLGTFFWSYLLVRFVEMTLFTILVAVLSYFPPGNHYIDQINMPYNGGDNFFNFNWNRFGNFLAIIWLYNIYMQSIGQLIAIVFLGNSELSLITSYVTYIVLCMLNGYLVTLEHMNNPILLKVAKLLASNVVSKGLLWSFYGLDRCDQEGYYSVILYKYYVDPATVYENLLQILTNTLILRLATITIMLLRCNLNGRFRPLIQSLNFKQLKPIDYSESRRNSSSFRSTPPLPRRVKDNSEIAFEEFSKNKIIVAWRNLTLFGSSSIHEIRSVKDNQQDKIILRDLNGQFCFGTMNVVMGTSGSGKTSLLKVLNGQLKTRLSDETQIFLSRFTPIQICYLTQEVSGHLLPGLTAKQSLIYASRLKNWENCYGIDVDHEQVAMNLLEELDLTETAETLVQNCSGGERKRLALALELTSMLMPNLICIDEPTSGLDSNSASIVMSCLREFVHKHHITIIASIHQPNTDLMNMFDQIYVLARGGVCIYSGPPPQIRAHLAQISEVPIQNSLFPIEELIKYSCMNHDEPLIKDLVIKTDLKIHEKNLNVETETQYVSDGIPLKRIRFNVGSLPIVCRRYFRYITGYLWQNWAMYLALYTFYALILRWFFNPKIALTDGCVSMEEDFNQACNRSAESIEKETNLTNNVRYNFFAFNIVSLLVMLQCGQSFINEFKFFSNEHRNGWYSTGVFYLTKYLFESIIMIFFVAFYVWIINIYEPIHPGIYWWLFLLLNLGVQALQGLSHFICVVANGNSFIFIALANVFYMLMLMTANFFCKISSLHYVLQMISYFSTIRFMAEANMLLQYGFGRCGPKHIQVILYNLNIPGDHYFYHCVQMLIIHIFLYRLMALAALIGISNPMENRRRRAETIMNYHKQLKPSNAIIPGLSSHIEFHIKKIQY